MSVKIELPMHALADPAVAAAVATLFRALGAAAGAPTARRGAPSVDVPPADAPAETRYGAFLEALPPRSRDFLDLVKRHGVLTIEDAMVALDVKVGKAMGGITGSIARWAPEHNVTVPFEAIKGPSGRRAWRWIGMDVVPPPPVPARARRSRRDGVTQKETPSDFRQRVNAVKASLPSHTERFLTLLESQGHLSQAEVLSHFGLARAVGLRRILGPLEDGLRANGLADLVEAIVGPTGDRSWRWAAPSQAATPPAAPRGPAAQSGVRLRRRKG